MLRVVDAKVDDGPAVQWRLIVRVAWGHLDHHPESWVLAPVGEGVLRDAVGHALKLAYEFLEVHYFEVAEVGVRGLQQRQEGPVCLVRETRYFLGLEVG